MACRFHHGQSSPTIECSCSLQKDCGGINNVLENQPNDHKFDFAIREGKMFQFAEAELTIG